MSAGSDDSILTRILPEYFPPGGLGTAWGGTVSMMYSLVMTGLLLPAASTAKNDRAVVLEMFRGLLYRDDD